MRRSAPVTRDSINAWQIGEVLIEHYRYAAGRADAMARHSHPDYQLCVSVDTPGEYRYRGAAVRVPARSVSVLHPDEPHAARDVEDRERPAEFWVTYLPPNLVRRAFGLASHPFLRDPVQTDPRLFASFASLPHRLIEASSDLARESLLVASLRQFGRMAGVTVPDTKHRPHPSRLNAVRERLDSDPAANPSLTALAEYAGTSPWRLCRSFREHYGEPPHAYLLHARIRHAKGLLLENLSAADVALRCGFTDQSHFSRHFVRLVGVTPGQYRRGKNVQDGSRNIV